jgi:hypothetical protein
MRLISRLLMLLVVLVLAAEGYGRYVLKMEPGLPENRVAEAVSKFAEFDPQLGMRYRLNIDQLIDSPEADFSILYKTNEIGLRDRPMGTHLRKELKFLVFGDEFAEGWGMDIDQTFVVRAQAAVNEKTGLQPPVRFVITGKSGYGAAQNYLAAGPLIDSLAPKAIVMMYSSLMPHQDALFLEDAAMEGDLATGLRPDAPQTVRLPHAEDYPAALPAWLAGFAQQSVAATFLGRWLSLRFTLPDLKPGDPLTDRLAGIRAPAETLAAVHAPSLKHVKALADLAASKGIPFMLIHAPLPPQVTADAWEKGRQVFRAPEGLMPAEDEAVVGAFCMEAKIQCLSLHGPLRDAAAKLESTRLYHPSELAFTVDGARVTADWFASEMLRLMDAQGWRD